MTQGYGVNFQTLTWNIGYLADQMTVKIIIVHLKNPVELTVQRRVTVMKKYLLGESLMAKTTKESGYFIRRLQDHFTVLYVSFFVQINLQFLLF